MLSLRIGSLYRGSTLTFIQIRHLFSHEELGIQRYIESRKKTENAIRNHDFYKRTIRNRLANQKYDLIQLETDLRNLVHIFINKKNDFDILRAALHLLIKMRKDYDGDKYRIGTILMRMFSYLKMPNEAIQLFDDEHIGQLFNEVTSYQILLDMLYENRKYNEIVRIYQELCISRRVHNNKYIEVIIFATYYRMNTETAYQQALSLWQCVNTDSNSVQFRKSRTFVAALAVNQRHPHVALDIVKGESVYVTIRHVKLMAWAQIQKFNEIFKMLKTSIEFERNKTDEKKHITPLISLEVLNIIEKAVDHSGTPEDKTIFRSIKKQIQTLKLITNESFDEIICAPFPVRPSARIYHTHNREYNSSAN